MSDAITLSTRAADLRVAPEFEPYSRVILHVSDDTEISVGDDSGRTMELDNPFGTRAIAEAMLAKLRGFQYQPFTATGALLDPAAEIGDGVNIKGTYGGIYSRSRVFFRLMKADISAPADEEIDHEYKYETPTERKFRRQVYDIRASLLVQSDRITAEVAERTAQGENFASQLQLQSQQIDAKVSATGGNNSSFGWTLTASGFYLYAGNRNVMKVTSSGLEVSGKITGTSGEIGGFTIGATAIYNNISRFGGTQSSGVYLGTNGIQLGQNFKVDTAGNATAKKLTVETLVIGGTNVSADTLNSRANAAYSSTSSGGYCHTGASYGNNFNNAAQRNSNSYPNYFHCGTLNSHDRQIVMGSIVFTPKFSSMLGWYLGSGGEG